jgi:GNAT superfamily N-acetyltransferase
VERDRALTEESGPFPAELVSRVVLGDGTRLTVRPIRPDDNERLVTFHAGLSPSTVYLRFFSYHRELSDGEVRRFTQVDYEVRLALVVENDRVLVAVGRYDRLPGTTDAEVAFVVADSFQHHGIGTLLLEELAGAAWDRGITHFAAEVLASNAAMLRVFFDSHYEVEWDDRDGTVQLRFPIDPAGRSEVGGPAPNHRSRP